MSAPAAGQWVGRGDVPWNILLVAQLPSPPSSETLLARMDALHARLGWQSPGARAVVEGEVKTLVRDMVETDDPEHPVTLGRAPDALVIRAEHAYVDGLGLLAVLHEATGLDIRSRARGVSGRPRKGLSRALAGRLFEVACRPPTGVAAAGSPVGGTGDVVAERTISRAVRSAELCYAAVQAVANRNQSARGRAGRIALATGVSTVGGAPLSVGEHSGFLRVRDAQRMDAAQMASALSHSPLEVGGTVSGAPRLAGSMMRLATTVLAARLGSTVLVSHLGVVEADVDHLAFYPVAANGSGLSVGGVTTGGATTLTLRARGSQHGANDLDQLLDAIVAHLS